MHGTVGAFLERFRIYCKVDEYSAKLYELKNQLADAHPGIALLYGITGSGKTSVYIRLIQECLDSGKYDCIMLPAYIDWHHEHRLVNTAVFELTGGRPASAVLWYAVTVPLASQFFTHYCAMDRVRQKAKWQVFSEVYLSQHMPLLRLRLQEKITGKIAGCFAAENYRLFPDGKDWGETMQKLALREAREYNQLQTIRNSSAHMVE